MSFFIENKNKIYRISYLILFIALIIYGYTRYKQRKDDINTIKNNYSIVNGEIIDYGKSGISGRYIEYIYLIKEEIFHGRIAPKYNLPCEKSDYNNCIGKKYIVIYSVKHPEKSYMLVERYGYELFNLQVPSHIKK